MALEENVLKHADAAPGMDPEQTGEILDPIIEWRRMSQLDDPVQSAATAEAQKLQSIIRLNLVRSRL